MLTEFLQKAMEMGADRLEIEYKDGMEMVTAFSGPMGLGIGSIDSTHRDSFFQELKEMKKSKRANVGGQSYRLSCSTYESFGETVYQIGWKQSD